MNNNNNNTGDKTFVDGLWIKQRNFDNGGSVIKVSVLADRFIEFINKYRKQDGFVNIDLVERREAKEDGQTHFAVLDTWKPQGNKSPISQPKTKKSFPKKEEVEAEF